MKETKHYQDAVAMSFTTKLLTRNLRFAAICLVASAIALCGSAAQGQEARVSLTGTSATTSPQNDYLDQDLRDVFEGLLDDLSPEVRECFEQALRNNSPDVQFTPEQFRAFRDNPANPFEGLSEIDPADLDGNIILKFELPSLRNRPINRLERQHPAMLNALRTVGLSASACTVDIKSDGVQVAAGIIVAEDGIIATKSSELRDASNVAVFFGDGRSLPAEIIRQDDRNDVALLKVPARHLPVVNWSSAETAPGIFVLSPSADGSVYGLGSYSVIPRSTIVGQAAFLGVRPNLTIDGRGLLLSEITPDTAASRAGLRNGDVMLSFAGAAMNSVTDLHREVKLKSPGDTVDIQFRRNGVVTTTSATLAGRNISGNQAKEFRMMNRLGAIPSRRAGNFPVVFQHDSPMFPEQIGGPVVDLNGNVIGMNISRTGRTGCYAIPSATMQQLVDDLLRENVASRE